MQTSGVQRTLKDIERPLRLAYAHLAPRSSRIRTNWRRLLERHHACREHLSHFGPLSQRIRLSHPSVHKSLCEQLEQCGLDLARKGVPASCAAVAVALYVECSIAALRTEDAGQRDRWTRALTKWVSVCQFLLLSGYQRHHERQRIELEKRVAESDQRAQDFFVEMADAYEKERRRLAQDLHDEIGHDLIVLKLYSEVTALELKKGDLDAVRRKLRQSVSLIKRALKGVRHLTFDLGPAVWHEQGFLPAVRLYTRQFAHRTGLKVRFSASRLKVVLPHRYETALYRILQGALSNIAAHSEARTVSVSLSSRRDSVVMRIQDDGKGFDVKRKLRNPPHSFGLRAMRDRIQLLRGSIQFNSQRAKKGVSDHGTTIEVVLPAHGLKAK